MSDETPTNPADVEKAERLRQAEIDKAERIRKAEEEKAERVRKAKEARAAELAAEAEAQKEAARKLLPSAAGLEVARAEIKTRSKQAQQSFLRQLLIFVALPTLLVTLYSGFVATPLYEARSVMVASKAGRDNEEGLGGLLGAVGGGQSNLHEAFMAHEYVRSRAMMVQLEQDMDLVTRYSGPQMDVVRRLRDVPALGINKSDQFSRFVDSSINIQTGLMTLYVRALSPDDANQISEQIITRVAERVNALSSELFGERIAQAEGAVAQAREALVQAQAYLTQLQIDSGEANPQARIEGIYRTIGQLETTAEELRGQIDAAEVAGQSDTYQTQRLEELEAAQQARIEELRRKLVQDPDGNGDRALNTLLLEFELAVLQVRIAEETLTAALVGLVQAQEEAALGRSQFQVVVPPNTGNIPSSPNMLINALIAFFSTLSALSIFRLLRSNRLS
ncbi:hypothetical protein [Yoonia sp. R2-816]|uniref:hypothetical protein n=1 Tax=Yoonia sp. R2-816 TaxID=3342638 RepID=UPI00372800B7